MKEDFKVLNRNFKRIDAVAKVTGAAKYTADIKLPGMLHCKMARSPHPFARIKNIDVSRAQVIKGSIGIITHVELVNHHVHVMGEKLDDKVRYTGESVVAVAAETERIADEAVRLVKVEYEPLKPVRNMDEAMAPSGPTVWPGGNGVTFFKGAISVTERSFAFWSKGNLKKGFEEADAIADVEATTGGQFHLALEPHTIIASWNRERQELNVWIPTQQIHGVQNNLAKALGINPEQVHVVCTYCGGGFGGKLQTPKEAYFAAFLSYKTGQPVRYIPCCEEDMATTGCRPPSRFHWKLGAKKNGKLTAISVENLTPCGPFVSINPIFILGRTDYVAPSYFISDNCSYEGRGVYTNNMPTAAFRGFGYFESGTILGIAVDILCEKLSIDSYDFHMVNMPKYGEKIGIEGGRFTVKGLRDALTACVNEAGWKQKRHNPGTKKLLDGRMHGVGLGFGMGRASLPQELGKGGARIKLDNNGKAKVFAGVSDMGQGQATGCAQIAAEALGMKMEDVIIVWGDTIAPKSNPQVASATTMMTGNAIKEAADEVRKKALSGAAEILRVGSKDLVLENGVFTSKSSGKNISYSDLAQKNVDLTAIGGWSVSFAQFYPRAPMFNVIEVAVDVETGLAEIINLVQATDCGVALSRSRVEGQMHGVLSGGAGFILMEDIDLDEPRMQIMNANMIDYKIYTSLDPNIDVMKTIIVEETDDIGPFGARGVGEAVLSGSGAALANAIYNAIGVRIYKTPFTPERILAAVGKVKEDRA